MKIGKEFGAFVGAEARLLVAEEEMLCDNARCDIPRMDARTETAEVVRIGDMLRVESDLIQSCLEE